MTTYHKSAGRKISSNSMTEPDNGPHKSSLQNQIVASLICNLGSFSFGAAIGWSSPALGELQDAKILSEEESAWAGGLLPLGALLSLPIFEYVVRNKGRKATAYLVGIPFTIGFALKAWGGSAVWILIGRFLCGLGGGAGLSLPPIYIGETCEPRGRGFASSLMMAEYSIGLLFAYILGATLPEIDMLPVALLPFPILFMIGFWIIPETPTYRLQMGQEEEAARALAWLRKLPINSIELKDELEQIARRLGLRLPLPSPPPKLRIIGRRRTQRRFMYLRSPSQNESNRAEEIEKPTPRQKIKIEANFLQSIKHLLSNQAGARGMALCLILATAQTFMGLFAVSNYAAYIFESAGTVLDPNTCAILYAVVVVIGSVLSSLLMDKAGRRMLQIGSCLVVCASELILAWNLQLVADKSMTDWMKWTPLVALPICVLAYNIGAGGIPFVIVSEIFAPEIQDIATNIMMAYIWINCFLLLQFFPTCVNALGLHNVFYGFSAVSFVSAVFSYFFLIETKGKSLEEILKQLSDDEPLDAAEAKMLKPTV